MAAADDKPSRSGPPAGPKPVKRSCPELSRRALLGAACAVPLLSGAEPPLPGPAPAHAPALAPALAAPPRLTPPPRPGENRTVLKWDRALARFRRAEGALAGLAHTEDDDLYDRALGRFNHALRALVRTPAPGMPAFVLKLDLAVDQEVATLTGGEACMAALRRDARRLADAQA